MIYPLSFTHVRTIFALVLFSILSACTSLPTDYVKQPSYAAVDTSQTTLGIKAAEILAKNKQPSTMLLINEGTDAFFARMLLLSKAERSIDVQYFIWHTDIIGKLLFNEMIEAAERGVRVRILLDDFNIHKDLEAMLYAMDQHKNITVHLFNPFASRGFHFADALTDGRRINRRMHNKSFTVDNQVTVVGGRNIGNEYFSADEESNFTDIDVMATGTVVQKVEKQFDIYWNSEVVYPISAFEHNKATIDDFYKVKQQLIDFRQEQESSKYALDIRESEVYKHWKEVTKPTNKGLIFSGNVKVIYDDPEKGLTNSKKEVVYLKSLMKPHLDRVEQSFELVSPYFVPGNDGVDYLISLVKRGIKVRVITNSLASTDGIMAQSGYARHRVKLLKGGVELYELKTDAKTDASRSLHRSGKAKSGLHAKIYMFDRKEIFIGSFNFDQRSANINAEVGIIYQIPEMAELIASTSFDIEVKDFTYKVELEVNKDRNGQKTQTSNVIWIERKNGKTIRHDTDPNTSWWRRFNENVFSILPIESQL